MTQDRWDIATGFAPSDVGALERDGFAGATEAVAPVTSRPASPPDTDRIGEQAGLRRRTLSDVARDLRRRGDRVVLSAGGRHFTGVVTHATGDLLTLEMAGADLHANLRRLDFVRVAESGATEGVEHGNGPSSFKARLYELELSGAPVRLGVDGTADELPAVIRAVGVDHLLLDHEGEEWVVPLSGVLYATAARA